MRITHMEPQPPSSLAQFLTEYGSIIVTGMLGIVAWFMKQFTEQHITSMKEMTAEVAKINVKVASMDMNIAAIKERQDDLGSRVGHLEDHVRRVRD